YDYFRRPDGRVAVICADVAGKGVPASLLMANLQAAVHVLLMDQDDLGGAMVAINRLVSKNVEGDRFITGVFALFDPVERSCSFVNAGHPPPICIYSSGKLERLASDPDLPLGVDADFAYSVRTFNISAEPCTVFFYPDGVPAPANEQGGDFGDSRLMDALKSAASDSPRDQISSVRRLVNQFTRGHPQNDDITMVAVRLQ